jgi:ATP/ADP translocase
MNPVCAKQTLFYLTLAPFFAFYSAFAFILYPLRHQLHPMHWVVPSGGLSFPVNLMRHWTFSLYYVVSELWGSAGIPLLFWSCANDLVSLEEVIPIPCFFHFMATNISYRNSVCFLDFACSVVFSLVPTHGLVWEPRTHF